MADFLVQTDIPSPQKSQALVSPHEKLKLGKNFATYDKATASSSSTAEAGESVACNLMQLFFSRCSHILNKYSQCLRPEN